MVRNQIVRLNRYEIIDNLLQGGNLVTTKNILEELKRVDIECSDRQIQKDIGAMRDSPTLGYFAPIEKNNFPRAWYYSNPDYSISKRIKLDTKDGEAFLFYLGLLKRYKIALISKRYHQSLLKS